MAADDVVPSASGSLVSFCVAAASVAAVRAQTAGYRALAQTAGYRAVPGALRPRHNPVARAVYHVSFLL